MVRASGEFARRRVALVGLQRSNAAVARFLAAQGAEVEAYDRKPAGELAEARALPAGGALFAGPEYLDHLSRRLPGLAAIFVTPGMPKDLPPLTAASAAGIPLWTEAAYVLEVFRGPVLAVTGSAGKTTTTTLVGEAVRRWRPGSLVGGNLGLPLLDRLHDVPAGAWLVLELSSFQLELARTSPRLAALLNVRPNHLDQHGSYEAYVDAKRRIYLHQGPEDVCIFGGDDPEAMRLSAEAPGRRLWFSARGPVAAGVGLVDGTFRWYSGPGADGEPLLAASAVRLPGRHNLENVAAAAAISLCAGAPPDLVASTVAAFRGVAHRQELVREWRGVRFVNDSIAIRLRYSGLAVTLGANSLSLPARPRYHLRGTRGGYVKMGVDPQETALGKIARIEDAAWGEEASFAWGVLHVDNDGETLSRSISPVRGDYRLFYAGVRDALLGKAAAPVTGLDGWRVARLLEWAAESSAKRREIACDWSQEPTL